MVWSRSLPGQPLGRIWFMIRCTGRTPLNTTSTILSSATTTLGAWLKLEIDWEGTCTWQLLKWNVLLPTFTFRVSVSKHMNVYVWVHVWINCRKIFKTCKYWGNLWTIWKIDYIYILLYSYMCSVHLKIPWITHPAAVQTRSPSPSSRLPARHLLEKNRGFDPKKRWNPPLYGCACSICLFSCMMVFDGFLLKGFGAATLAPSWTSSSRLESLSEVIWRPNSFSNCQNHQSQLKLGTTSLQLSPSTTSMSHDAACLEPPCPGPNAAVLLSAP